MFKIYTKTGDQGETGLFGGRRVLKSDLRVDAYGTTDELNSFIGLLRDSIADDDVKNLLKEIQDRLFTIGANLASDPDKQMATPDIENADIELLEKTMDVWDEKLPPLRNFILPGGHTTVSFCHIARTVCRRSERLIVALSQVSPVDPLVIQYLNRLSDCLFVLARKLAQDIGIEEITWQARKKN